MNDLIYLITYNIEFQKDRNYRLFDHNVINKFGFDKFEFDILEDPPFFVLCFKTLKRRPRIKFNPWQVDYSLLTERVRFIRGKFFLILTLLKQCKHCKYNDKTVSSELCRKHFVFFSRKINLFQILNIF